MKRSLIALILALLVAGRAPAQVSLPPTGALAGPLDSAVSVFGDEFINFPEFMQPKPAVSGTRLNGWMGIQFLPPVDGTAQFLLRFGGAGTDHSVTFGGGQRYDFFDNRITPRPFENVGLGVLDLASGEIVSFQLIARVGATSPVRINKVNRLPFGLQAFFPPPDLGVPTPPTPPGFIVSQPEFLFDSGGRITGFRYFGKTIVPAGLLAPLNGDLGLFPFFSFGPDGAVYFANPDGCGAEVPLEACPTDIDQPDGIPLSPQALLHPFFIFESHELRPVNPTPVSPGCTPIALADGAVVAASGGRIYHAGGVDGAGHVTRELQILDPATGLWSPGPPMPHPVVDAQGAAVGDRIYVIGGRSRRRGPAMARLQIFDTISGLWSMGPSAPLPIAQGTTAVVGDLVYVLGGGTNRPNGSLAGNLRPTPAVQAFDPLTGSWISFPAIEGGRRLFLKRPSAVAVGSDILLIGGLRLDGTVSRQTHILDTFTLAFKAGPDMLHGVYDAVAGLIDTRLFVAGGRRVAEGPSEVGMQLLEFDRGVWLDGVEAPVPVAAGAGTVIDNALYLLGGRVQSFFDPFPGTPTRATQVYDPSRGWRVCESTPFFNSATVMNTASLTVGAPTLAPGSQASVIGWNLGPQAFAPPNQPAPVELAGVSLRMNGRSAPILAIYPNRVDFQVPWEVEPGMVELELTQSASRLQAPPIRVRVAPVSPGIFIQSCGEVFSRPYLDEASAIACNENGSLNYAANTARPGDVVTVQMTGLGAVEPTIGSGERGPAGAPPEALVLPTVSVLGEGGESLTAEVLSAHLTPGEVGIYNVQIRLPAASRTANRVQIQAQAGGISSNRAMLAIGSATVANPLPCLVDSQPEFRLCLPPNLGF